MTPIRLDEVDLARTYREREYEQELPKLQFRLAQLAGMLREARVSTAVVLEGWFGAGKGEAIFDLTQWLDARGYKVHPIHRVPRNGDGAPWLRRFALREPPRGSIALFDRSWYLRVTDDVLVGDTDPDDLPRLFHEIRWFEKLWIDEGIVLIKLFLHLSKKEQAKRIDKRRRDEDGDWEIGPEVELQQKRYKRHKAAVDRMVEETGTTEAPWTLVSAEDRDVARLEVFRAVLVSMERKVAALQLGPAPAPAKPKRTRRAS